MSDVIEYRAGARNRTVPAAIVAGELQRIHAEAGELVPQVVVDEARPEEAVLHPAFEWDDEVAGEEWRKWQARQLIRTVVIRPAEAPKAAAMPIFVHAPAAKAYHPLSTVVQQEDLLASAVQELLAKAAACQALAERLRSLAEGTGHDKAATVLVAVEAFSAAGQAARAVAASFHQQAAD